MSNACVGRANRYPHRLGGPSESTGSPREQLPLSREAKNSPSSGEAPPRVRREKLPFVCHDLENCELLRLGRSAAAGFCRQSSVWSPTLVSFSKK